MSSKETNVSEIYVKLHSTPYCSRVISKPHYIYVNLGTHRRLTMIKYNIQDEKLKFLSKTSGLHCRESWYGPLRESALCT